MRFIEYTTTSGQCPVRDFIKRLQADEQASWAARVPHILERLPKQRLPAGWVDAIEGFRPMLEFRFEGRHKPIRIIWVYGRRQGDILLLDGFYKADKTQEQREYRRIFALFQDWERQNEAKRNRGR